MTTAAELDEAVRAVCPIDGVNIGRVDDRSTWSARFKDEATDEQRKAAQSVIDAFDPSSAPSATTEEKLAAVGLAVDDIRAAIADRRSS